MELVVSQAAAGGLALASTNVAAGSVTLATQTAAVGVILPPPDIRSIVVRNQWPEACVPPLTPAPCASRTRLRSSWHEMGLSLRSGACGTLLRRQSCC